MAWTLVQSAFAVDNTLDSTVGFSSAPTEGNLLVAVSANRGGVDTSGAISGWTQVDSIDHKPADGTFRMSATVWVRIAEASEPSGITFPTATEDTYYNAAFEFEPVGATPLDLFRLLAANGAASDADGVGNPIGSVATGSLNPASDTYCKLSIGVVKNTTQTHDPLSYDQDIVAAAVDDSASNTGMTIGIGVDTALESTPQSLTVTLANDTDRGIMAFYVLIPEAVPVREFDGVDDELITSIGSLSSMTYGTVAAIFKQPAPDADDRGLIALHDSGGSNQFAVFTNNTDGDFGWFNGTNAPTTNAPASISANDWMLVVGRKGTGTASVRFSIYNFASGTWVHDGAGSVDDSAAPGASGTVRFANENTSSFPEGLVAVRGVWSNSVPWPADASGDTQIEAAGLEVSLDNWADSFPDALWAFDQDSTATAVSDLTGGGADQSSITGTTVITNDPVPGFSYEITTSSDVNVNAEAATVAATAHDPMANVGPVIEAATVGVAAHDATVARAGNPDAEVATVAVAAQDATVDAVSDAVEANAQVAMVTVDANSDHVLIATTASHASVATAGQGPDITATGQPNAGLNFIDVDAFDATVTISGEGITVNAEVATVSVVAHNATPTGEANAEAEAATITVTAESTDKRAFAGSASVDVEARDPQVAINAGVIATAERAEVQVAALNATVSVSDNVSDSPFTANVSVSAFDATTIIDEPPEPLYTFFPPTVIEHFEHLRDHAFLRKITWEKGVSVVKKNGTFVNTRWVVPDVGGPDDLLVEGVDYFLGGFHYIIPESIALQLIADGYEPELIE